MYRRAPGVLWRRASDRALVLCGDDVHDLVGSAAAVWDVLHSSRTLEELLDVLAATFRVDRDVLRPDVRVLLVQLEALGIIEEPA